MYKTKEILVPIYNKRVTFILTDNVDKLNKKFGLGHEGNLYAHTYFWNGNEIPNKIQEKGIYVILNPNHEEPIGIDVMVHELVHVKNQIYKNQGIFADPDNDEPEAYLMDYLTRKAYKFYKKYLK